MEDQEKKIKAFCVVEKMLTTQEEKSYRRSVDFSENSESSQW